MELWIPVTIAAASFQTVRFMLQKVVSTKQLSAGGATFARFIYSAPLVLAGLAFWLWLTDRPLPDLSAAFWGYGAMGGMSQILATVAVVLLFRERNFAVGITFKKTEVILAALVGLLVLGEAISLGGLAAILIGLAGVLLLSRTPGVEGGWMRHLTSRASLLGLGSGMLFAISGVSYRGASLEIDAEAPLRAGVTLAAVVTMQALAMAVWLFWRERGQITAVWHARKTAVWIGLMSLGGSFCWFLAFTLQTAAYVKALGQVELVLSLTASMLFFREKVTTREVLGMALLGASILLLIVVL